MEKHWLSWRFLESSFCKAIFWNRSRPKFPSSLFLTCNLGSVFSVGGPKLNSWKDPLTTSKKISSDCWCILTLFSTYCFKREKEPRNERTVIPKIPRGLQRASGYTFYLPAMLLLSQVCEQRVTPSLPAPFLPRERGRFEMGVPSSPQTIHDVCPDAGSLGTTKPYSHTMQCRA